MLLLAWESLVMRSDWVEAPHDYEGGPGRSRGPFVSALSLNSGDSGQLVWTFQTKDSLVSVAVTLPPLPAIARSTPARNWANEAAEPLTV